MNDATDFPIAHVIAHYDRPRTNSIRSHDALRNESLPVHARAYRAFSSFSTLPREGQRTSLVPEMLCVFPSSAYTCCLNIGCERVHVDRFARGFLGSWCPRTLDDYAMTEPSHMDKAF